MKLSLPSQQVVVSSEGSTVRWLVSCVLEVQDGTVVVTTEATSAAVVLLYAWVPYCCETDGSLQVSCRLDVGFAAVDL